MSGKKYKVSLTIQVFDVTNQCVTEQQATVVGELDDKTMIADLQEDVAVVLDGARRRMSR